MFRKICRGSSTFFKSRKK